MSSTSISISGRATRYALVLAVTALSACAPETDQAEPAPADTAVVAPDSDVAAASDAGAQADPLAGTRWQLVEIQSMDDAIGTARPEDATWYGMRLDADGAAFLTLDCNTATGRWIAEPSADPSNGTFRFEDLSVTEPACPPPSLADRLAADLPHVRGFLLRDGRLYLSLFADGGILAWEPLPGVPYESDPDPAIEAAILRAYPDFATALSEGYGNGRYVHARLDLNDDGRDEVFVFLVGPYFCGTGGCTLLLFRDGPGGLALMNGFPISRTPIVASERRTNGWRDLVRQESGGGAPTSYVRHRFDGTAYVEHERALESPEPDGLPVLSGGVSFQGAIPLEPED